MLVKYLGTAGIFVLAAAAQENRTVALNGGLQAQMLSLGRTTSGRPVITAAVKITNTGKDNVFLMFYGSISAVDEAGNKFDPPGDAVSGIGYCNTEPAERCIGKPNGSPFFPFQSYTVMDPGKSVTAHFRLVDLRGAQSAGKVSLSAQFAYRLVKETDMDKEADVPDAQKLRQIRTGNMSFEPLAVTEK